MDQGRAHPRTKHSRRSAKLHQQSLHMCKARCHQIATLSQLVSQFQVHKCNTYCQKSYRRNGKFCKKCRFGFPRPAKQETDIHDLIDCLAVEKNKQPRKRLYQLQRSTDEAKINDYNPALLLANQATLTYSTLAISAADCLTTLPHTLPSVNGQRWTSSGPTFSQPADHLEQM